MTRPTLQEIADMPHCAGLDAVRQHYDPHWLEPRPDVDPDAPVKQFKVTVEYVRYVEDCHTVTVEASTREEAIEIAEDEVLALHPEAEDLESVADEVDS